MSSKKLYKFVLSAMFLALALVLPFLTGSLREIGKTLCPMHIPVILCGFFCGPFYALAVGFIAPLLRFLLVGMPLIMPTGIAMAFELAAYGFFAGLFYKVLPKKTFNIYVSLILSMLVGRAVWGAVRAFLYGVFDSEFGFKMFFYGAFVNSIPGIIIQIVLIPVIVITVDKRIYKIKRGA